MISIDWLSIVMDDDRQEIKDYIAVRLQGATGLAFEGGGGLHGYESSLRSEGVVLAFGGASQKGTMLLSLSGDACGALGWYGCSALVRSLIKRFSVRVKFSRIDLALDVVGEWWQYFDSPDRVLELLKDKRIKTISITNNYERQEDESGMTENWIVTGHTTYIGSRTSERFMRIYKKQMDDGRKVTRFEYELKHRYALVVGGMMISGESVGAAYIFANTNHIDLTAIYDLSQVFEPVAVSLPRKKERRTYEWLLSLSKALWEFIEAHPGDWRRIMAEGESRSPVGNTGVHIREPKSFAEVAELAFNDDTFGSVYHPLYPTFGGFNV